ncbi:hypothetical protein [Pseudomonas mandelii]|uniref:hypothetical protein n=1 Tax=Pseudomonas mandelii TaxID=75612 RepID=UPI00224AC6EF|nr:hypothetical protein [Pseudomonas mandelii]MCX2896388.1 hypothetical protein [Pseudomonas mandelii]
MTATGVEANSYVAGKKTQRFAMEPHSDGTVGFRKVNLVFNTVKVPNDLDGTLEANIRFAQCQTIHATLRSGDRQPHLAAYRATLLMVKPLESVETLQVTVLDRDGNRLGSQHLNTPEKLPQTLYHADIDLDDVDFIPLPGSTYSINTPSELQLLSNPSAPFLRVEINSTNRCD